MTRITDSRATQRRAGTAWLLVGTLVAVAPGGARASETPAQRCSVAKSKAAAKKIVAKLTCQQKAIRVGAAIDPTCLTAAETKFDAAIVKAEAPGGCGANGDGPTIESAVDSCVDSIVTLTAGTTSTTTTTLPSLCCATSPTQQVPFPGCTMDPAICTRAGATVEPGVCRNDGTCGAATGPGECCDFAPGECIVLAAQPGFTQTACSIVGGTFKANSACTPAGCQ
jgi:hypothetical protein